MMLKWVKVNWGQWHVLYFQMNWTRINLCIYCCHANWCQNIQLVLTNVFLQQKCTLIIWLRLFTARPQILESWSCFGKVTLKVIKKLKLLQEIRMIVMCMAFGEERRFTVLSWNCTNVEVLHFLTFMSCVLGLISIHGLISWGQLLSTNVLLLSNYFHVFCQNQIWVRELKIILGTIK